jgi:hypothetical protein
MNIRQIINFLRCRKPVRRIPGRFKVRDASFPMAITFRMGGLYPGMVTRTHPQWIEPNKADLTNGPLLAGQAVKLNTAKTAVIAFATGATDTMIYGVVVRVYPFQQYVLNGDGTQVTPAPVVDVLREGYIGVKVTGAPNKGDPAYVNLTDASFAATGTTALTNAHFNGLPDAAGNAELVVTIQN